MKGFIRGFAWLLLMVAATGWAQQFPTKPIRIVVPFSAGNAADSGIRLIANRMAERNGWTVIVDNKPGGNYVPGGLEVRNAPADGHTILASVDPMYLLPLTEKPVPFDLRSDFVPLSLVFINSYVVSVTPSLPVKTFPELVAYGKANPGKLSWGGVGGVSTNRLAGEMLKRASGLDITFIPYKTTGQLQTDVMSGTLHAMLTTVGTAAPLIQSGKKRGLLVLGPKRSHVLPDVPASVEAGLPASFEASSSNGFMVRAGTPPEVVSKLHQEIIAIMQLPEVKEQLLRFGVEPTFDATPQVYGKRVAAEVDTYARVLKESGIVLQ